MGSTVVLDMKRSGHEIRLCALGAQPQKVMQQPCIDAVCRGHFLPGTSSTPGYLEGRRDLVRWLIMGLSGVPI